MSATPTWPSSARDLARLAREPEKAQMLVDRMVRMLSRGQNRRTRAVGVPLTGSGAAANPYGPEATPNASTPQPAPPADPPRPVSAIGVPLGPVAATTSGPPRPAIRN